MEGEREGGRVGERAKENRVVLIEEAEMPELTLQTPILSQHIQSGSLTREQRPALRFPFKAGRESR